LLVHSLRRPTGLHPRRQRAEGQRRAQGICQDASRAKRRNQLRFPALRLLLITFPGIKGGRGHWPPRPASRSRRSARSAQRQNEADRSHQIRRRQAD